MKNNMPRFKVIFCLILISYVGVLCRVCFAGEMLIPKEIVELVQASKQRYNSFEIEFSEIGYNHTSGKQDANPEHKSEILWRKTESRSYVKIMYTAFEYQDGNDVIKQTQLIRTYVITPEWSKRLQEMPIEDSPKRGHIIGSSKLEGELGLTIVDAMWGIFGQPWDKLADEEADLIKDSTSGLYILKREMFSDSTTITVTVDPDKGFLPIKYEFNRNGSLLLKCVCSDFKEIEEGLWIPYQYIFNDYMNGYTSIHNIKKAKINIDIPEELLNFSFPPKTLVSNEILGIRYVQTENEIQSIVGKSIPVLVDIGIELEQEETENKRILVCFFDLEQRPSRNCILELSKRVQELKAQNVEVIAIQASKIEQATLDKWIQENNISFPVGLIEAEEETQFKWGVKSLPWLILTDKNHIVTAEGFSINELDEKIQDIE